MSRVHPLSPTALCVALTLVAGCGASLDAGGRVYDNWAVETGASWKADSAKTPAVDGAGGPGGDGRLYNSAGKPLANTGHSYRFKNLWGWDLRGAAGIYGPKYQNKATVRAEDLLADTRSPAQLKAWFKSGAADLPAWGAVLSDAELDVLVAFVDAMRSGRIPRASDVWTLSETAPKNYTLNAGADPARGAALVQQRCAGCHGAQGRKIKIDGVWSLGAFGRAKAYEGWFKILAGHPGSWMKGQVPAELDRKAQAAYVRDILAGLCDRARFPALPGGKDVQDGDPRCGAYLK